MEWCVKLGVTEEGDGDPDSNGDYEACKASLKQAVEDAEALVAAQAEEMRV